MIKPQFGYAPFAKGFDLEAAQHVAELDLLAPGLQPSLLLSASNCIPVSPRASCAGSSH